MDATSAGYGGGAWCLKTELRRYKGRTVVMTPASPLDSVRAWRKFTPPMDSE
jgi:hypothetical protein